MVGILILARLGSKRLPQKHLMKAGGKTFISWLILRYIHEFSSEIDQGRVKVILATSNEEQNTEFENQTKGLQAEVFYGNINNVPLRELECAEQYNFSHIISIDGDDILCSTNAARLVYNKLMSESETDFVTTKGLPLGMNVMGFKKNFLKQSLQKYTGDTLETGWGRIFNQDKIEEIELGSYDKETTLRFTLDYPVDAEFFKVIIEAKADSIISILDDDLIKWVIEKRINKINGNLSEQYWQNFNTEKQKEIQNGN